MTSFTKRKPYRNKKILAAAKGERCLVNLPGCNGGGEDTVAAHSNCSEDGKGIGQKADDIFVAFACHSCHCILDGKKKPPRIWIDETETKNLILWYHDRGIKMTIRRLLDLGVIK